MTAPERIWLQDGGDFDAASEVTWCQHSIDDADTEYIRADLAAVQPARVRVKPLGSDGVKIHPQDILNAAWRDDLGNDGRAMYNRILTDLEPVAQQAVTVKPFGWIGGNADCHHSRVNELAEGLQSCTSCGAVSSVVLEPQPDPRDEVIKGLVEAVEAITDYGTILTSNKNHDNLRAALAAAKAVQK